MSTATCWRRSARATRSARARSSPTTSPPSRRKSVRFCETAPKAAPASGARRRQHDRLQLGEGLHDVVAADTADARAGAGATAEGQVSLPVVGRLVDVDPARVDLVGEAQALRDVGRE